VRVDDQGQLLRAIGAGKPVPTPLISQFARYLSLSLRG